MDVLSGPSNYSTNNYPTSPGEGTEPLGGGSNLTSSASASQHQIWTLNDLLVGETGVVRSINSTNSLLRNKLLSMGVVNDTPVLVTHVAPLGDPITISVRGFQLSLRRSEARTILMAR